MTSDELVPPPPPRTLAPPAGLRLSGLLGAGVDLMARTTFDISEPDNRPPVVRRDGTLRSIHEELAKQVQEEYSYWIERERKLRDDHVAAAVQVEIREELLERLARLLEVEL